MKWRAERLGRGRRAPTRRVMSVEVGGLEVAGDRARELSGGCAVEGTVVPRQAERQHRGLAWCVAVPGDPVAQPADTHDGGVRAVDDRREPVDPVHPERGDRERATFQLVQLELAVAHRCREPGGLGGQRGQVERRRVLDHGDHQSFVDRDRHADVDVREVGHTVGGDLAVGERVLLERLAGCGDHVVGEAGHRAAVAGSFGLLLATVAVDDHGGHVGVHEQRELRHLLERLGHPRRDRAADAADRHDPRRLLQQRSEDRLGLRCGHWCRTANGSGRRCELAAQCLGDQPTGVGNHVVTGQPWTAAECRDRVQVDPELVRELAGGEGGERQSGARGAHQCRHSVRACGAELRGPSCGGGLDVLGDDATAGAGPGDERDVDAELGGHPLGVR